MSASPDSGIKRAWVYFNRNWLAAYLLIMPIGSITIFFLPLHVLLGISVRKLLPAFGVFCLIGLPLARGVYWAQPQIKQGRIRPLYTVMSLYIGTFFLLSVFFGTTWGYFDAAHWLRNTILAATVGFGFPWLGYFLRRKDFEGKQR